MGGGGSRFAPAAVQDAKHAALFDAGLPGSSFL